MIETAMETKETKATTMSALERQADDLTQDLRNVRGRFSTIYDAMNGESPVCEDGEAEGRAAGFVGEISRMLRVSSRIVMDIKKALSEIEGIILPENDVPKG